MSGPLHQTLMLFLAAVVVACAPAPPDAPTTPRSSDAPPVTPASPTVPPSVTSAAGETSAERRDRVKIQFKVHNKVLTATMIDSPPTRDLLSLLPLSVTLEDYAGTEKIYYLPQRLSTEDMPAGSDPSVGDIAYYAPWGNLAIFYKDSGYANGLVILGKIDGGMDALSVPGSIAVTIESIK